MSCNELDARVRYRKTQVASERFTIGGADPCDHSDTEIFEGEAAVNTTDGSFQIGGKSTDTLHIPAAISPDSSKEGFAPVWRDAQKKYVLESVSTSTDLGLFGNVLFVAEGGDNDTATKGDLSKPWADPWTARDAWTLGDIVYVLPGTYTIPVAFTDTDENASLIVDGITFVLSEGATIISNVQKAMLYDVTGKTTKIYGNGILKNTAGDETNWFHNIYVQHENSNHEWYFQEMNVQAFLAWQGGGIIRTNGKLFSERAGQYRFRPQMNNTKWFHQGDIVAQGIGAPEIGGDPDSLSTWWQCGQLIADPYTGCEVVFRGNIYNFGWGGSRDAGMAWVIRQTAAGTGFKVDIRGDIYCPFLSGSGNKQENVMVGCCDDLYFEGNVYAPNNIALWGLDHQEIYSTNTCRINIPDFEIKGGLTATNAESTILYERARGLTGNRFEMNVNGRVTDGECFSIGGNEWENGMIISGNIYQQRDNTDCFQNVGTEDIHVHNLKIIQPIGTTADIFSASSASNVYVNGNVISNNVNQNDANVTLELQAIYSDINVK